MSYNKFEQTHTNPNVVVLPEFARLREQWKREKQQLSTLGLNDAQIFAVLNTPAVPLATHIGTNSCVTPILNNRVNYNCPDKQMQKTRDRPFDYSVAFDRT